MVTQRHEQNFADHGRTARDAAHHALAKTGVEAGPDQNEVGGPRPLNLHHLDSTRRTEGRSARRKRSSGDERGQNKAEQATVHE